jgi:hypothetical protein
VILALTFPNGRNLIVDTTKATVIADEKEEGRTLYQSSGGLYYFVLVEGTRREAYLATYGAAAAFALANGVDFEDLPLDLRRRAEELAS